jgi:hypothetical protein
VKGVVRGPWSVARETALCLVSLVVAAGGGAQTSLDDFASVAGWTAAPSDGVTLALSSEAAPAGRAMRLDFDFHGHGGWAAVRKGVDIDLPANYAFTFRVRGVAPVENLEFKLVDSSGENVWWSVRREFAFPHEWQTIRIRKRDVSFAWGPAGGGGPTHVAAIELAITAGSGGKGSVWISELALAALPPEHTYPGTPVVTASSSLPGRSPEQALTGAGAGWHSNPSAAGDQWLQVDFGERRELGGLVIDWDPAPGAFEVSTSEDGAAWTTVSQVKTTRGGRSYVPMPEADARFVRLTLTAAHPEGIGVRSLAVQPIAFSATANAFIASVAAHSRRGLYPRGFLGEMTAWTVVGRADGTQPVGLLGADGAFEPAPRSFSLEPFVWLDGALLTWADVSAQPSLAAGYLPIPTVTWKHGVTELEITALADAAGAGACLRYRLTNRGTRPIAPTLVLAARPFQVDPPSQFLNIPGGTAPLAAAACEDDGVRLGRFRVRASPGAARCGATAFDDGDIAAFVQTGSLPTTTSADGPYPSAALEWRFVVPPGAGTEVVVTFGDRALPLSQWNPHAARTAAAWRRTLGRVRISGPPEVEDLVGAMESSLAYILESRDGPALRPGTRSYARSWIRDGAMMAAALLRLGHAEEVRDYLRWYAGFQFEDGKVPCCVDHRGADPVAENDSNGEFLFLAAEYVRFTGDAAAVAALWPHVVSAVAYLDGLRTHERRSSPGTAGDRAFVGLLPASISHEGYSARPMHSYWDDLWALAGVKGAAWLAARLGHSVEAARWSAMRDELQHAVLASIAMVRDARGLDYIPGCAELGDFDPTSTTVALWPAGAELPREAVEATYERYWREVEVRFTGKAAWESYTPYEWRNVGAFVRLGWRDRALRLARWLMADRMPVEWNQWPEIVWRDRMRAHFLGDLPHAWVGSDFIRSFLDMLAYERPRDGALVLAAGVPIDWVSGEGVTVRNLHTQYGRLAFSLRRHGDALHVRVDPGLRIPPGGVVLHPPLPGPSCVAVVNGARRATLVRDELVLDALPADVLLTPAPEER